MTLILMLLIALSALWVFIYCSNCCLIALWPRKMKIDCSRLLLSILCRTDRRTNRQTLWHLELLSEPKIYVYQTAPVTPTWYYILVDLRWHSIFYYPGSRLCPMLRPRQVFVGKAVDQRQSVILLDQSESCNGFQWEVLEEVWRGGGCQEPGSGTSWCQHEHWACAGSDDSGDTQQPVTRGQAILN